MIDDKSLRRAITSAAKNEGCSVWIDDIGEDVNFWCSDWCVITDKLNLRDHLRGAMGLIVEMLGYLPHRPVRIVKGKGEFLEEPMLDEVAEAEIAFFHCVGERREIRRLPLTWRLSALWQDQSGAIYGCHHGAPACVCRKTEINANGNILMLDADADEAVVIAAFTPGSREEREFQELRHLRMFDWHDWMIRQEPVMDQMEVEDE